MKKKLKDITIGEVKKECEKHAKCDGCPLHKFACHGNACDNLDEEIELTENES